MIKQETNQIKTKRSASRTTNWLSKAQAGEIPVNLLEKLSLDRQDVVAFLSSHIPLLRSSARGAGLGTLALFFDELNTVLQESYSLRDTKSQGN